MTPPQSRSLGGRGGDVNFTFKPRDLEVRARDLQGRFATLQGPMKAGFEKMAIAAQADIVGSLERSIRVTGRTQRKTSALVVAMASAANRDVSFDGFVVGTKRALDAGVVAPYYRNLETGTRIFVGRELTGFFVSSTGRKSGASRERVRADPRLIQTRKFFAGTQINRAEDTNTVGDGRILSKDSSSAQIRRQKAEGRFRPAQQKLGRSARPQQDLNKIEHKIIIRNPIPAYQYFLRGGLLFLSSGVTEKVIAEVCKGAGIPYVGEARG